MITQLSTFIDDARDSIPTYDVCQKLSKDGGDGMTQASLVSFSKSVRKLWEEYTSTLRQRNLANPKWFGTGEKNRPNRHFYHRKCVFYREIARQYELNGSDIEAALTAVQAFLDPYFQSGGGGWEAAEWELRRLTPADGTDAVRLTEVYESL